MCGFAGFLQDNLRSELWEQILIQMGNQIKHRGPDDAGIWFNPNDKIGLSFRRLSILDLSNYGHQPMKSPSGKYVMVFNGEVYNYLELKQSLIKKGYFFSGGSDTEVILSAIEEWGLESAVKRFNGMFAIALWDCSNKKLFLIRDRLGIKPLHYGLINKTFFFGSEIKALKVHPNFHPDINRNAISLLLRDNYISAPYTIYNGLFKLNPGTILEIKFPINDIPKPKPYWTVNTAFQQGITNQFDGIETEATNQLENLLCSSVKLRMVADVPIGAFLSGGIDSSLIVALMQKQSSMPIETFTIGFQEKNYNEAIRAKSIAKHLGTQHTDLYLSPNEAMDVIPKLPTLYDEPFADFSQIPTYLVSELAQKSVLVSLSGDGGDELFGGYNHYLRYSKICKIINKIPYRLRKCIIRQTNLFSDQCLHKISKYKNILFSTNNGDKNLIGKIEKLEDIILSKEPELYYWKLLGHWKDTSSVVLDSFEPLTTISDINDRIEKLNMMEQMMYVDTKTYLPDDILVKVDRASMGVSLEARVPMLDHRIVEFAARLPISMKIQNNQGKIILRNILYKYLPKDLINQQKKGFGIPIGQWIRGPLRDWAESLLNEKRLNEDGFFNPEPIRKKFEEHISGKENWEFHIWSVLMFQAWHQEQ